MTEEPENIVLKQLSILRGEMQEGFATVTRRIDVLDQKVGSLAQTLVGVQRDIRRLVDGVGTLGAAVDEHTHRLDRIEQHLGLNA